MTPVMDLRDVRDTTLWKRLREGFAGKPEEVLAEELAVFASSVCADAADRMRAFPSLHTQYTLHDEKHLLRVTELMAKIMPAEVLERLNPVEIYLLILVAHLHDQGMVLNADEIARIRSGSDPEYELFKDNWEVDHPNLGELRQRLGDHSLSDEQQRRYRRAESELLDGLLTDYVRQGHGRRSAQYVRGLYQTDPRFQVTGASVASLVADLCQSHVEPANRLTPDNGFPYERAVGTHLVNLHYLAVILRLADILDLDRDRTPDPLYRTIHFTNDVSLTEWEKHRTVEGWIIRPGLIQFTMSSEHPAYQRAACTFMDWIDHELAEVNQMVQNYPAAAAGRYDLDGLPPLVNRKEINPKDDAYIYRDLEFSLSRNEIVKLFMTEDLYKSSALCVRELLQNALDALRHRAALIKRDTRADWRPEGRVTFEHFLDEDGQEILRCTDNGVGMDVDIIENYLTNVGRSYYRSPEFRQKRNSLASADADFDPVARFGIGFMSCFMLGDRIKLRTRRDYGPKHGQGRPLEVEINGLGGLVVIRDGAEDQDVGTTVEIVARERPLYYDENLDNVKLIQTVYGYAVACEFPVQARCDIEGIRAEVAVPAGVPVRQTEMEWAGLRACVTLEQDYSDIHPLLNGRVRASFLVDEAGDLVLSNREAAWVKDASRFSMMDLGLDLQGRDDGVQRSLEYMSSSNTDGYTCLDGILVSGRLRRPRWYQAGVVPPHNKNLVDLGRSYFVLNAKGYLKPPLTPARVPAGDRDGRMHPEWLRLIKLACMGHGRVWEQVAEKLPTKKDAKVFWQLAYIYMALMYKSLPWMRAGHLWSYVLVPFVHEGMQVEWRKISSLGYVVSGASSDDTPRLLAPDGAHLSASESLARWARREGTTFAADGNEHEFVEEWDDDWQLEDVVISMSTLTVDEDGQVRFELRSPDQPDRAPWEYARQHEVYTSGGEVTKVIPYSGELREAVSARSGHRTLNRGHPLVGAELEGQYKQFPSDFERFAEAAIEYVVEDLRDPADLTDDSAVVQNHMRYLGNLYRAVDWSTVADHLHPPYDVWFPGVGPVGLTSDTLERWAASPSRDRAR